jgi:serine/threonine-protein kinase RsbW
MLMSQSSPDWSRDVSIPSTYGAGKPVIERLLDDLQRAHWCEQDIFGVHLAVEEAMVNAILHGNRLDQSKQVRIAYRLAPDRLWIEISDEGNGFDPDSVPDPTRPENLPHSTGRGVLLMRNFMSKVEFSDRGKRVVMEKKRDKTN